MNTFRELDSVEVRERALCAMRVLSRENTFKKVEDVCERAEHPELGAVALLSKWRNSRGEELGRVAFTTAGHDEDETFVYAEARIQYANCAELSKRGAR